jgi:hypothetical protein
MQSITQSITFRHFVVITPIFGTFLTHIQNFNYFEEPMLCVLCLQFPETFPVEQKSVRTWHFRRNHECITTLPTFIAPLLVALIA